MRINDPDYNLLFCSSQLKSYGNLIQSAVIYVMFLLKIEGKPSVRKDFLCILP